MTTTDANYLSTLHKQINEFFSFAEVRTLCFDLGVDYENIPGNIKSAFIRNLIVSLARQDRLQALILLLRQQRPHIDWQDVPADFSLPQSVVNEDIQQVVNYTVYGDLVHGDKVSGDKITVGDILNADGVAVGSGASVVVNKTTTQLVAIPQLQEINKQLNRYLQLVSPAQQTVAAELTASVKIILDVATAVAPDKLHLKLLLLGQEQLAAELEEDVPGLGRMVARFATAVADNAKLSI